jgi:AraC-like DNA-binding protein
LGLAATLIALLWRASSDRLPVHGGSNNFGREWRRVSDKRPAPCAGPHAFRTWKAWRLGELARASAMSRTSFAERFRTMADVPPLTYLNSWRMLLAQRALRDRDKRVGQLAVELGYTSESAFSNAFKREVGMSPMRYRVSVCGDSLNSGDHRRLVEIRGGVVQRATDVVVLHTDRCDVVQGTRRCFLAVQGGTRPSHLRTRRLV